jgi:LysM repeat protein
VVIGRILEKPLKTRLILSNTQDFDPLSTSLKDQMTIKKRLFRGFITAPTLFALYSFSGLLNYSAFSFLPGHQDSHSENLTIQIVQNTNSQNLSVLEAAKNIDPLVARGGGDINIVDEVALAPESGVSGTTLDIEKADNTGRISLYTVRDGDTLSQIAEMFDVSVNTIRWANDFSGSIHPGQDLVILPVSGLTHTVKSGGTIDDIAEIYEADVREIALFNGLDESVELKPGDEIIVPNADLNHGNSNTKSASGLAIKSSTGSGAVSSGYFINPVPGGIITQALHGYNGVDTAAAYGTPILAAASGKVITSKQGGWNGGYGNYIVISHDNGTQTLYSHQSQNIVYVGQSVEKGEVIGYMGSTGRSTGNHLHFEVRGAYNILANCSVGSVCR